MTHPYAHLDFPPLDLHLVYLNNHHAPQPVNNMFSPPEAQVKSVTRTLKSTPIVALASSSGNHCLSEKRSNKLLFPTDELPMSSSLTLMSSCGVGAISYRERDILT